MQNLLAQYSFWVITPQGVIRKARITWFRYSSNEAGIQRAVCAGCGGVVEPAGDRHEQVTLDELLRVAEAGRQVEQQGVLAVVQNSNLLLVKKSL